MTSIPNSPFQTHAPLLFEPKNWAKFRFLSLALDCHVGAAVRGGGAAYQRLSLYLPIFTDGQTGIAEAGLVAQLTLSVESHRNARGMCDENACCLQLQS